MIRKICGIIRQKGPMTHPRPPSCRQICGTLRKFCGMMRQIGAFTHPRTGSLRQFGRMIPKICGMTACRGGWTYSRGGSIRQIAGWFWFGGGNAPVVDRQCGAVLRCAHATEERGREGRVRCPQRTVNTAGQPQGGALRTALPTRSLRTVGANTLTPRRPYPEPSPPEGWPIGARTLSHRHSWADLSSKRWRGLMVS